MFGCGKLDYSFNALSFALLAAEVRFDGMNVRLVSVTYMEGQIRTRLRIYNGRAETLDFTQDDIWLALGCAPEPPAHATRRKD
jgi:hypothetical protein